MHAPSSNHRYKREDCIVFFKTHDRWGELSNMAAGFPIIINGTKILTSEALFQACRFPHLPDIQRLLIDQASPMAAKMKSRPYRKDTRTDWEAVNNDIMRWCVHVKLAQNWKSFGQILLATGAKTIVEESHKDSYWGAIAADEDTLQGVNVLGRMLTELRDTMLSTGEALRIVHPPAVENFLLLGLPIDTIHSTLD